MKALLSILYFRRKGKKLTFLKKIDVLLSAHMDDLTYPSQFWLEVGSLLSLISQMRKVGLQERLHNLPSVTGKLVS